MATKKAAKPTAVNVKALSAELGATVKEGRVSVVRGKYFVTLDAKKVEIPVGQFVSEGDIKKMVGRNVGVVVSKGTVVGIGGIAAGRCYWIVCYKPVASLLNAISPELRQRALEGFVQQGVIPEALAQKLAATD